MAKLRPNREILVYLYTPNVCDYLLGRKVGIMDVLGDAISGEYHDIYHGLEISDTMYNYIANKAYVCENVYVLKDLLGRVGRYTMFDLILDNFYKYKFTKPIMDFIFMDMGCIDYVENILLCRICCYGQLEILHYIITKYNVDPSKRNNYALLYSVIQKRNDVVNYLLGDSRVDVTQDCMKHAYLAGHKGMIDLLVKRRV